MHAQMVPRANVYRVIRRLLAALAVVAAVVVVAAAPASAHAELLSTTPSSGQVLQSTPDAAIVRFDQRVQVGAGVELHDGRGRRVDDGGARRIQGGKALRLPLPDLADGGYVLSWRVVSADGHPVSGGITFRVGDRASEVDQGVLQKVLNAERGNEGVRAAAAVDRTLLFLSLLVLVGGLVFLLALWPEGWRVDVVRASVRSAALIAAVTTYVGMTLQGADVAGLDLGHAVLPSSAWDTLDTAYGKAAALRLALLAVAAGLAALLGRGRALGRRWQLATLAVGAALLATVTFSGHARTGRWLAASAPLDLLHLGAAAVWIGGLVFVCFLVLPRDEELPLVHRFSRIAWWSVVVLVTTGVVQAIRQTGGLDGIRSTDYGHLLVVKVVLVAIVVTAGGMSRSLLKSDDEVDRRALRRSVGAEAALAVVVLAVTSLLVAADPGREASIPHVSQSKVVQGTILEVEASPTRTGPVDIHLYATDPSIPLTTQLTMTATMSLPSRKIPPIVVPVQRAGRAHWSAYDVDVPIAGTWKLQVRLTIGEFESRTATLEVPIE
jgi:copper transport protein